MDVHFNFFPSAPLSCLNILHQTNSFKYTNETYFLLGFQRFKNNFLSHANFFRSKVATRCRCERSSFERAVVMAAASLDDFCRCSRKLIEKKDKFYLKLFGEKSSGKE